MLQVHRSEGLIYMVLEYGDIDLARLLQVGPAVSYEAAEKATRQRQLPKHQARRTTCQSL